MKKTETLKKIALGAGKIVSEGFGEPCAGEPHSGFGWRGGPLL